MRILILVAVTAIAALAAGWYVVEGRPAHVAAAALSGGGTRHPQEVRSVKIVGDRLPRTMLESRLVTKIGEPLDSASLEADRRSLREALVARGHWAAEVAAPDVLFGASGGAHVAFRVEPGSIYHVREVALSGDTAGVPALRAALTVAKGDEISPQRLARNVELLTAYLARHGKPGTVAVETTTDREALAVDVRFVVRRVAR